MVLPESRNVCCKPIADIRCRWHSSVVRLSSLSLVPLGVALLSGGGELERVAEPSPPEGITRAAAVRQQHGLCPERLPATGALGRVRALVVLVETEPWAMVIGADSPRFVLYSDGLVIYRSEREYRSVRLLAEERRALLASINIEHLACFTGEHGDTSVTDQPYHNLFLGRSGPLSLVSVYGARFNPSAVPPSVQTAHARLRAFSHPRARKWLPERIEVMIWPYEYAPDASIDWPAAWPGLNSEHAVRRGDGYSIFVPAENLERLSAFLATQRERGAVQIGGRKWAASLRFPFPMERMWMETGAD